jgi:hypothetical protein
VKVGAGVAVARALPSGFAHADVTAGGRVKLGRTLGVSGGSTDGMMVAVVSVGSGVTGTQAARKRIKSNAVFLIIIFNQTGFTPVCFVYLYSKKFSSWGKVSQRSTFHYGTSIKLFRA